MLNCAWPLPLTKKVWPNFHCVPPISRAACIRVGISGGARRPHKSTFCSQKSISSLASMEIANFLFQNFFLLIIAYMPRVQSLTIGPMAIDIDIKSPVILAVSLAEATHFFKIIANALLSLSTLCCGRLANQHALGVDFHAFAHLHASTHASTGLHALLEWTNKGL